MGLLIILYVAITMMWHGAMQVRDCNPSWFGIGTEMTVDCPLHPDYKPSGH